MQVTPDQPTSEKGEVTVLRASPLGAIVEESEFLRLDNIVWTGAGDTRSDFMAGFLIMGESVTFYAPTLDDYFVTILLENLARYTPYQLTAQN